MQTHLDINLSPLSFFYVKDDEILVAIEEERLTRVKHWAGFPKKSIKGCMKFAKVNFDDLDYISINRDPNAIKNRMTWGTPAITSNSSAIPEICGNAAVYFNPMEIHDIVEKMILLITDRKNIYIYKIKVFNG